MNRLSVIESIYFAALEKDAPVERAAYLDQACGEDQELRRQVERLLQARPNLGRFLAAPLAGPVDTVDALPITEAPGTVIGPYKLLEQIGEGGFGVVFMAEQTQPVRRKVALKVLKPGMDSRQVIARFEAERQALALMEHPNITRVLDAGATASGRPYFVMELVKGIPITDYCDHNHLPIRQRLELFFAVCQAVQHAHQKGIIHRDLKPSNVLVTLHDGTPVVKVIDFGVAKAIGQQLTDKTLFTGFAQLVGTPLYMSPEQAALSSLDVDTRSDIYALGVLLYELLTGTTPFSMARLKEVGYDELRRIICEEEPLRPSTRMSTLGQAATAISTQRKSDPRRLSQLFRGELDWIVMKCLEKDRNRRYETANSLARDVERYLHNEPVQACPPSAGYRLRKFVQRHKGPVVAAGLVLLSLLMGIAGTTGALLEARRQRDQAQAQRRKAHQAVQDYFTRVSESTLLREPALEPLRRQLLRDALRYYQDFVQEHRDNPELQAELVATYSRISILTYEMGPEEDWVLPFQQAVDILEALLRKKPDPSALGGLKIGIKFGNAMRGFHVRNPDTALRTFERARTLWEELVRLDPTAPGFRNNLAMIHTTSSALQDHAAEAPAKRVRSAQKAVELWQQLVREEPNTPHYRAALATTLRVLGTQTAIAGESSRSEEAMRHARQTAEQLAADFPGVPGHQELLRCIVPEGIGYVHEHAGRLDKAETAYREMLAGQEALAKQYPSVERYQVGLFWARRYLGLLLWAMDRPAEAAEEFRQLQLLGEQLSRDDPDIQDGLAWMLATCPDSRFRHVPRAIQLAQTAVDRAPGHGIYWATLGAAHYAAGDYQAAVPALEKAVQLPSYWGSCPRFYLAMAKARLGQQDEARRWYEKGVARLEQHELRMVESLRVRDEAAKVLGIRAP